MVVHLLCRSSSAQAADDQGKMHATASPTVGRTVCADLSTKTQLWTE